jgi:protein SCO1/2
VNKRKAATALAAGAVCLAVLLGLAPARAQDTHTGHSGQGGHAGHAMPAAVPAAADDPHAAHRAHAAQTAAEGYRMSTARYEVPDLTLVDSHGRAQGLRALLQQERPVLLQFIYTTCTTVCPVLSATFAQAQKRLDAAKADYLMVSVSIDPEYDTPARLADYAKRFGAGGRWVFLTGKAEDIQASLRAFDSVYASFNKMNHQPATLVKGAGRSAWRRFDGFVSTDALMQEYAKLGTATTALAR